MITSLKEARDTIAEASGRLTRTAEDTRAAMIALAVLGVAALLLALLGVALALRGRGIVSRETLAAAA